MKSYLEVEILPSTGFNFQRSRQCSVALGRDVPDRKNVAGGHPVTEGVHLRQRRRTTPDHVLELMQAP